MTWLRHLNPVRWFTPEHGPWLSALRQHLKQHPPQAFRDERSNHPTFRPLARVVAGTLQITLTLPAGRDAVSVHALPWREVRRLERRGEELHIITKTGRLVLK